MEAGVIPAGLRLAHALMDGTAVRAAGGVVWRDTADGGVEVLLVHRPRYDDWTLPKGKVEPGEADLDCALREVAEETGLVCEPGVEVGATSYVDRNGRQKAVRYWAMQPRSAAMWTDPNASTAGEVDRLRWVSVDGAAVLLTYGRDADIVDAFVSLGASGPGAARLRP